jgi:hypothetical protein
MSRRIYTLAAAGMLMVAPALAHADVAHDWNTIMLSTISAQSAFAQARFAAITQLAVFEAVNACTGQYKPYTGAVPFELGASPEAAAIAAAHGTLKNYFPANAAALDAARTASLAAVPEGWAKQRGIAIGEFAAAAMIGLRNDDGSSPPETFPPGSVEPGVWQPTPPLFGPGVAFNWPKVAPFGIKSGGQFRSGPPPALTSDTYRRDYDEVKTVGEVNSTARSQNRSDVARFMALNSPNQLWNLAVQQVSIAKGLTLAQNARAFALLNMAISDAQVAVFDTKYFYNFWRPVTAIRAGATDGNPNTEADGGWTPFITTPAFPSYPSGHGCASGAARRIAELLFGNGGHSITLSRPNVPGVVLHYTTFRAITDDVSDARVYGGIHFRFDQDEGGRLGRRVGTYVYNHNLRRADR